MDFSSLINGGLAAGGTTANNVSANWDNTWNLVLTAPSDTTLYGILAKLGVLLALITMIFMLLELYRDVSDGKNGSLSGLIWPVIVAFLLINHGVNLGWITLAMRNGLNQVSTNVLSTAISGAQLNNLYQKANGNIALQGLVSQTFTNCKGLSGEAQSKCLSSALDQAQSYVNDFGPSLPAQVINSFTQRITDLRTSLSSVTTNPGLGIFKLVQPSWMPIVTAILFFMQIAYQNMLEAALLITALFGPVAVGGSLSPYGPKAIFAWLTGFFGIGFGHICFNIIIGLTALISTETGVGDPTWFAIFSGIFAPILASALAAGGGLVVWSALTSSVSNTFKAALDLALKII